MINNNNNNIKYISHINNKKEYESNKQHLDNVAKLSQKYSIPNLRNLNVLIAKMHDFGKYTIEFSNYILASFEAEKDEKDEKDEKNKKIKLIEHSVFGAKYIYDMVDEILKTNRLEYNNKYNYITRDIIVMIIMSHHTGLNDYMDINDSNYIKRLKKIDTDIFSKSLYLESKNNYFSDYTTPEVIKKEFIKGREEIKKVISQIINDYEINKVDEIKENKEISFYISLIIKYCASILADADCTATTLFCNPDSLMFSYSTNKYKNNKELFIDCLKDFNKNLSKIKSDTKINKMRQQISDDCLKKATAGDKKIYTLSTPAGSGKTMAVTRFVLNHAIHYNKQKIIYIAPYCNIIEQNTEDIINSIGGRADIVLEQHSSVDEEKQKQILKRNINNVSYNDIGNGAVDETISKYISINHLKWDYPIISTTYVQFYDIFFKKGSKNIRRFHELKDSIIIIDEIQQLPIKLTILSNLLLNFLCKFLGCTVILCTATQPAFDNKKTVYPLKITSNNELISNLEDVYDCFQRVNIKYDYLKKYTYSELASKLVKATNNRISTLAIINTTKNTRGLYKELKKEIAYNNDDILIFHLSTKMCPTHRLEILNKIKQILINNSLTKDTSKKKKIICVSTPLIEAGINISFANVFRSICGLPSITQASGRCNRNGELKDKGDLIIFTLINEKGEIDGDNNNLLKDIVNGRESFKTIYNDLKNKNKLFYPESIRKYYNQFYQKYETIDYEYKLNNNNNIFDFLSKKIEPQIKSNYNSFLHFSFNIAYKNYRYIDSDTFSVFCIINKESQDLADRYFFNKNIFIPINYKLLQKYIVNLYSYEIKELIKQGYLIETNSGIYVLDKTAYNKNYGVDTELINTYIV